MISEMQQLHSSPSPPRGSGGSDEEDSISATATATASSGRATDRAAIKAVGHMNSSGSSAVSSWEFGSLIPLRGSVHLGTVREEEEEHEEMRQRRSSHEATHGLKKGRQKLWSDDDDGNNVPASASYSSSRSIDLKRTQPTSKSIRDPIVIEGSQKEPVAHLQDKSSEERKQRRARRNFNFMSDDDDDDRDDDDRDDNARDDDDGRRLDNFAYGHDTVHDDEKSKDRHRNRRPHKRSVVTADTHVKQHFSDSEDEDEAEDIEYHRECVREDFHSTKISLRKQQHLSQQEALRLSTDHNPKRPSLKIVRHERNNDQADDDEEDESWLYEGESVEVEDDLHHVSAPLQAPRSASFTGGAASPTGTHTHGQQNSFKSGVGGTRHDKSSSYGSGESHIPTLQSDSHRPLSTLPRDTPTSTKPMTATSTKPMTGRNTRLTNISAALRAAQAPVRAARKKVLTADEAEEAGEDEDEQKRLAAAAAKQRQLRPHMVFHIADCDSSDDEDVA